LENGLTSSSSRTIEPGINREKLEGGEETVANAIPMNMQNKQ